MTANELAAGGSVGLGRRRRVLQSLIARYDNRPDEREQLLTKIVKAQLRLGIYKRGNCEGDDALAWVDRWKPSGPRPSVLKSILAAF